MEKRTKRKVIPILTCFFLLYTSFIARAESLPQLYEGSATLADVIMSYYAMSGAGVANETWINNLYNSYGNSFGTISDLVSQGALVMNEASQYIPTQSLEDAIANAPAYQSLNIGEVFNISSSEAAATGAVAASGAGTLAGALGGVATTGVIPLLGAVTVAYWGGIGLGTIAAHLLGLYDKNIYNGVDIDQEQSFIENSQDGYGVGVFQNGTQYWTSKTGYTVNGRVFGTAYPTSSGTTYTLYVQNKNASTLTVNRTNLYGNGYTGTANINLTNGVGSINNVNNPTGQQYSYVRPVNYYFQNESEKSAFIEALRNGTKTLKINSPDLIGENGNLNGDYNNGAYSVPDLKPQIDPGVEAGKPLRLQDWLNFANGVKNNNSNTSPNADPVGDNKNLYLGMVDSLKTVNPNPNPNPNPDPNPDPYAPPNPNPTPDPDYGDPNPDQPEWESETGDIPDPVGTGNPWVLPDITDKFPFCIPKDLKTMAENFKSTNRQAPYISWRFNPPFTPVDYTFNLDLSDFEDAATLLRSLELIGFVVGLAVATRYLIGAT